MAIPFGNASHWIKEKNLPKVVLVFLDGPRQKYSGLRMSYPRIILSSNLALTKLGHHYQGVAVTVFFTCKGE
jgi:hypothetical protein